MPRKKFSSLAWVKKELKSITALSKKSFEKIDKLATAAKNKRLSDETSKSKRILLDRLKRIQTEISKLQEDIEAEMKKKTEDLQKKMERFRALQKVAEANNYLLEHKRKDLLIQSEEMEEANKMISRKNEELLHQKEEISEQVEELNRTREEILEKKNELEEKMSALLDQADYLHEANEVISNMHAELAKQKDEIVSKNEELVNLNQEKNNLIGIVAHDLKSPLNQIKGLVSIIRMTTPDMNEEAVNCLGLIESSAIRLNGMISKILDIEAIEAQTLNLNIQLIDFGESLNAIVDRFKLDAYNKQISLHFSSSTSALINADISYFNQIFENLLSNAIKFSPAEKNIYVTISDNNGKVTAAVRDEGPGLSDEDKKKLFNKYQKLSAKPTGNESSTGLGLSIVKKFVESMNGKIWCESEPGNGATFFVQFPKA